MYTMPYPAHELSRKLVGRGGGGGSSSNKKIHQMTTSTITNTLYSHVQLRIRYLCIAFSRFAKRVFIYRGAFKNAIIIPRFHSTRNM